MTQSFYVKRSNRQPRFHSKLVSLFPSYPKPLYQSEAEYEAIDMKIFHSHANETHALSLVLKVRVFETQKWSISFTDCIPGKPAFPSPEALRR